MGKALRLAATMCGALLFAVTWSGDVAADVEADADASPTESISEPITETALPATDPGIVFGPSADPAVKDPLAPYGIGPAEESVAYEALPPEEQEVADRGREAAEWSAVHNMYGAAVIARSKHARAEAAQHQLGVDSLDTIGVVQ